MFQPRPLIVERSGCAAWLVLLLLAGVAVGALVLDLLTTAFVRIGFSWQEGFLILLAALAGSRVNIPLLRLQTRVPPAREQFARAFGRVYRVPLEVMEESTSIVALNVGGALVPVLVSAYLLVHFPNAILAALAGTLIVAMLTNRLARPVAGVGIVVPGLLPPLVAALAAVLLATVLGAPPETRFVTAYVSGTIGTLAGADLMNLPRIRDIGAPLASIGGAGTFDGIFLAGIVAVLLV